MSDEKPVTILTNSKESKEEISAETLGETPEQELRRWRTAFDTDNLAHAIIERQSMISLIKDLSTKTKNPDLLARTKELLKGIK